VTNLPTKYEQDFDRDTDTFLDEASTYLLTLEALRDTLDGDDNYLEEVAALSDVHTQLSLFFDVVEQLNLTLQSDRPTDHK
jgi:hypothetical protein